MTNTYKNVYVKETSTIGGIYEANGPLVKFLDKVYDKDFYYNEKSFEKAEVKLLKDSINLLLEKTKLTDNDIDLLISGDLLNQMVATNYASATIGIPLIGIYSACSTSALGLILGSNMIDSKQIKNCIVSVSSHNNGSEKQFRQPVEYGGPKKKTSTFTVTGAASAYLSGEKGLIKVESATIGKVVDLGITDSSHMGAVMAPSAAETIYQHLKDTKRDISYYD